MLPVFLSLFVRSLLIKCMWLSQIDWVLSVLNVWKKIPISAISVLKIDFNMAAEGNCTGDASSAIPSSEIGHALGWSPCLSGSNENNSFWGLSISLDFQITLSVC